jgi:hypothetical protein
MSLLMISETMCNMEEILRTLSNEEKEFIMQFAFKTSDKDLTGKLIEELADARDGDETKVIMKKYSALYDVKPSWVNQIENLLVSIEMYRVQEEKAITRLAEVLGAYGIDVSEEELRQADAETIKAKVSETQKEEEEMQEEDKQRTFEAEQKPVLSSQVL